jgi:hypothetical protein
MGSTARRIQKTLPAGGKVVVTNHCMPFGQKPLRQSAADEPGTTCNKVSQLAFLYRLAFDGAAN